MRGNACAQDAAPLGEETNPQTPDERARWKRSRVTQTRGGRNHTGSARMSPILFILAGQSVGRGATTTIPQTCGFISKIFSALADTVGALDCSDDSRPRCTVSHNPQGAPPKVRRNACVAGITCA